MLHLVAVVGGVADGHQLTHVGAQVVIILGPGKVLPIKDPVVHQLAGIVIPAEAVGIDGRGSGEDIDLDIGVGPVGRPRGVVITVQDRSEPKGKERGGRGDRVGLFDTGPIGVIQVPRTGKDLWLEEATTGSR